MGEASSSRPSASGLGSGPDPSRFFPNHDDVVDLVSEDGSISVTFGAKLDRSRRDLLRLLEIETEGYSADDYSVFSGKAGLALLYVHLASLRKAVDNEEDRRRFLSKAHQHLKPCLTRLRGRRVSFLCGDAGPVTIKIILDYLHSRQNSDDFEENKRRLLRIAEKSLDPSVPDELLYGRAGVLYALLLVRKECGDDVVSDEVISRVAEAIVNSGRRLAKKRRSRFNLLYEWHESEYVGAAHGLAGIFLMLLQARRFLPSGAVEKYVKPSIDELAALQLSSGNFPSSLGGVKQTRDKLVQFCHGAPGVVHLFLLAARLFPEDKVRYLEVSKRCADVSWRAGLLKKGYGLCHGAAGNAYTFLALYDITGDKELTRKALTFADFCCDRGRHGCPPPDQPFCLMNGLAGTVWFLYDVSEGGNCKFPAMVLE